MEKNKKTIVIISSALLLIGICAVWSILALIDTVDKKTPTIEELVMLDMLSLSMENVYATGDCSEVIQKTKDKHWENINKSKYKQGQELAWYAAGLVLAAHYVAQDCDTAESELDEILRTIQIADHETGQSDIRDDIAAAMRFVKALLNE